MHGRSALSLLIAGALSLGSARISAAQVRALDEGTFVVLRAGAPTRTESFKIVRNAEGQVTATGTLSIGTQTTTSLLSTDSVGSPLLYELKMRDRATKGMELRALARAGRLSSMAATPGGDESMREFPLSARAAIVDAGFIHHLYFVVLGKAPGGIQLIEPRAMRSSPGQLSARGLEPVTVGGKSVTATHYSLVAGALRYDFWVDAKGRLLRVDGPDGLSATRDELPR